MKPRELILSTGTKIFLGRNSKGNDELVSSFRGKENVILHTIAPGSPFCVIERINPEDDEIYEAGIFTALKSQDWRDHKRDVPVHVFTGHDVVKYFWMKEGSWKLKNKPRELIIKRKDLLHAGNRK
jgi:predicted ribosome quality control (RQC) complex YloA/Tae2 family protein